MFWERHIGLSQPFWNKYWGTIQNYFPCIPSGITSEQAYTAINVVDPSILIRVESDEVCYPLHVKKKIKKKN